MFSLSKIFVSLIALGSIGVSRPPPTRTFSGRLDVRYKSDPSRSLGFVINSGGIGGLDWGGSGAIEVSFDAPRRASCTTQFSMLVTNPNFDAPFYVGAAGRVDHIGIGTRNRIEFTNVPETPPGSLPVSTPSGFFTQSGIWSFEKDTGKLSAQLVNGDGTTPETIFAFDIRNNRLFFIGDLELYNSYSGASASPVDLILVPNEA